METLMQSAAQRLNQQMPQIIRDIHAVFMKTEHQLVLVGGCVRDAVLNRPCKDYDVATDATPEQVISLLTGHFKLDLQGKAFGVVIVSEGDTRVEIATFRKDEYGDNLGITRNPSVSFTTIFEDVSRRDFTINALFFDLSKNEIVDLVGGLQDIENKVVRFVGEPSLRIQEDPLRIIRLARFAARFNFDVQLTEQELLSVREGAKSLSFIAKDRFYLEFRKASETPKTFKKFLDLLVELDAFSTILPNIKLDKCQESENWLVCFASMLVSSRNMKKLEDVLMRDLCFDSKNAQRIVHLVSLIDFDGSNILKAWKRNQALFLTDEDILALGDLQEMSVKRELLARFVEFRPSVDAKDFMSELKGRELGDKIAMEEDKLFLHS